MYTLPSLWKRVERSTISLGHCRALTERTTNQKEMNGTNMLITILYFGHVFSWWLVSQSRYNFTVKSPQRNWDVWRPLFWGRTKMPKGLLCSVDTPLPCPLPATYGGAKSCKTPTANCSHVVRLSTNRLRTITCTVFNRRLSATDLGTKWCARFRDDGGKSACR